MARAVLGSAPRWAAALVLAAALSATLACGADKTTCSSRSLDPAVRTLQQQTAASAFYKELLLRYGKPLRCSVEVQDSRTDLTYTFRHGAQLIARIDPKAEFSEQRMELVQMSTDQAIALLKRAELSSYPPGGCGISWTSPEEESTGDTSGTHETVYRGDTCNCQARLTYKGQYIVVLVLRSAC